VTIAAGGVLPNIHQVLLPKGKEEKAESSASSQPLRRLPAPQPLVLLNTTLPRILPSTIASSYVPPLCQGSTPQR
jgi:hypothetical protein